MVEHFVNTSYPITDRLTSVNSSGANRVTHCSFSILDNDVSLGFRFFSTAAHIILIKQQNTQLFKSKKIIVTHLPPAAFLNLIRTS